MVEVRGELQTEGRLKKRNAVSEVGWGRGGGDKFYRKKKMYPLSTKRGFIYILGLK